MLKCLHHFKKDNILMVFSLSQHYSKLWLFFSVGHHDYCKIQPVEAATHVTCGPAAAEVTYVFAEGPVLRPLYFQYILMIYL